jgi:hypothetical protein
MYHQLRLILFGALLLVVVTIMGSTTAFAATTTSSTVASSAGVLAPQSQQDYRNGWREGCNWGYSDWSNHYRYHYSYREHGNSDYRHGEHDGYDYGWNRHSCPMRS